MNKEKILKIIVLVVAIIEFLFIIVLVYSNNQLKQEMKDLKCSYKELEVCYTQQEEKIFNIETKINSSTNESEEQKNSESDPYFQAVNNLDSTIFLIDFENYAPNNNDIKITEKKAKEIAQNGFEESKRIASEGTDDIDSETIKIEEVVANNYFTRYYYQRNELYDNIKRNCYAIQRENDMGCGVTIYVDVTTGLIIGGRAFGD